MARSLLHSLPELLEHARGVASTALATAPTFAPTLDEEVTASCHAATQPAPQHNLLIRGDNLMTLAWLAHEGAHGTSCPGPIDLIYIDPPFATQTSYNVTTRMPAFGTRRRGLLRTHQAYHDSWPRGIISYLEMILPRLILMRELLAETGSLYVHVDWRVASHLKILLDEIFGSENLIRQIIWAPGVRSGFKSAANNWLHSHDVIFYYAKNRAQRTFTKQFLPYGDTYLSRFTKDDGDGRLYRDDRPSGAKQYLDTLRGVPVGDVWTDIPSFQSRATSREYLGYDTQKPRALLERIISASTQPGDLVADFFGGSGTTASAAEALGRRWVVADSGASAVQLTRRRLIREARSPFRCLSFDAARTVEETPGNRVAMTADIDTERSPDAAQLLVHLHDFEVRSPGTIAEIHQYWPEKPGLSPHQRLALIESWSIDPDYDGLVFRSRWHGLRTPLSGNHSDPRVPLVAHLPLPTSSPARTIAVRATDVFGGTSVTILQKTASSLGP